MSRLPAGLVLAVALAVAAGLAGCGTQKLDVADAETTIGKRLTREAKAKVTVTCPDDVKIKKGDTFNCTAKTTKDTATVKVTQLDGEGRVRWELKGR